ncbi:MAG: hypothetical protein JO174_05290 [Herbaspirillum sp.]|nr:hypothetical protein [Herbaspirillum sp.]
MDRTKVENRAIALSVLAGVVGVAFSIALRDGTWFSRAGAAITAAAVWFASRDLKAIFQATAVVIDQVIAQNKVAHFKEAETNGLDEEQNKEIWQIVERDSRAAFEEANRHMMSRVHKVELYLFIIGTFIWGFGDLPFTFYYWLTAPAA